MNKNEELRDKRAKLWYDAREFLDTHRRDDGLISYEDEIIYEKMVEDVKTTSKEIERLEKQALIDREIDKPEKEKPQLWIEPYYVAAWKRIGELVGAIERQYESADGSAELVEKWANEISWQASMIEALRGGQDEQKRCD